MEQKERRLHDVDLARLGMYVGMSKCAVLIETFASIRANKFRKAFRTDAHSTSYPENTTGHIKSQAWLREGLCTCT